MSTAYAPTADDALWAPKVNPWFIGVVVSLAAFMEVLDTSIANVALPYIAGDLGASNDESTWVLTTYLVANAIVLPISGFLVGWLGRKRFFMGCIVLFTVSSFLCGIAPSLGLLLVFRIMQGAFGGGLQPMVQAILTDTFPPQKRGLAFALYGITVVCAPAIGPTLGGWITDSYSWRWIFFINVPVGMLATLLVYQLLEDPPYLSQMKSRAAKFDYIGFALLVLGVSALQITLDKGQEDDWLGSRFITTLIVSAAVGLISLVIWEWFRKEPLVDVRLFRNVNFAGCNVMFFALGVAILGGTVLMPLFLQTLMGYTAELAGMVLSGSAVLLLLLMPLVGRLTSRFQARHLIAFGWITMALGMFVSCRQFDTQISFQAAAWLRVLQYLPVGFLIVPITASAYAGISKEKTNAAAGLMNFTRNIGMSVGTSAVTTLIERRSQYHQSVLAVYTRSDRFHAAVAGLAARLTQGGLSAHAAHAQALGRMYFALRTQSQALSYVDVYWLLAAMCLLMFSLSFLLQKNTPGEGEAGPIH
jgi:MFS transporter, DHA2 family, multidrug resistance protein